MKNQSTKALLLLGGLLLATTPAKAENQYDQSSYWLGFTAGAATTVCLLVGEEFLPKEFAEAYVDGIRERMSTDASLTKYKSDLINSFQMFIS